MRTDILVGHGLEDGRRRDAEPRVGTPAAAVAVVDARVAVLVAPAGGEPDIFLCRAVGEGVNGHVFSFSNEKMLRGFRRLKKRNISSDVLGLYHT